MDERGWAHLRLPVAAPYNDTATRGGANAGYLAVCEGLDPSEQPKLPAQTNHRRPDRVRR